MKRQLIFVAIVAVLVAGALALASAQTVVYVPRLEEQGRLLVEMRTTLQLLGWQVNWHPAEERVDASYGDRTMVLWMDEPEALVNGQSVMLDVPPRLMWNRTFVPLRFVAEAIGAHVEYSGNEVRVTGPLGDLVYRFYK